MVKEISEGTIALCLQKSTKVAEFGEKTLDGSSIIFDLMLQVTRAPLRNSNGYSITRASFNPLDVQVSLLGTLSEAVTGEGAGQPSSCA